MGSILIILIASIILIVFLSIVICQTLEMKKFDKDPLSFMRKIKAGDSIFFRILPRPMFNIKYMENGKIIFSNNNDYLQLVCKCYNPKDMLKLLPIYYIKDNLDNYWVIYRLYDRFELQVTTKKAVEKHRTQAQ